MTRRRAAAVASAITFALFALVISPGLALGQAALEEWEEKELRPLVEALQVVLEGAPVPGDDPFAIKTDFMKGGEGSTFAPLVVTIDPSKVRDSAVTMYLFVEPHVEPIAEAAAEADADATADDPFANRVYEDVFWVDVSESRAAGGPLEIERAFHAPGGVYDVYVVIRDSKGEDGDEDDFADSMIMMVKAEVEVPDFWNNQLETSTVLLTRSVDVLPALLEGAEAIANPYTLGQTQLVMKHDLVFTKAEDLSLILFIYNAQLSADQAPNVTVTYDFHTLTATDEEFFNRTTPQEYNAQTLAPGQDVTLGIPAGQGVPLSIFPAGDHRLDIKITDNARVESIDRVLNFTVTE